jgi:hypothetical protein
MKKHFAIKNFCNNEEVSSILDYYDALEEAPEFSNQRAKRKNMNYHDPDIVLMREIIEPKIKNFFPNAFVSAATFTNWVEQVELHTDSWQPDEDKTKVLGYSILVPLRISPTNIETSTIIFDQYTKEKQTVTFKKFTEDESWNIAKQIGINDSKILNKSNQELDQDFYNKYLGHIDYNIIKNFSNPTRYVWTVGDAVVWNREHFHTSENFNPLLNSKLHMIFLVNFHN